MRAESVEQIIVAMDGAFYVPVVGDRPRPTWREVRLRHVPMGTGAPRPDRIVPLPLLCATIEAGHAVIMPRGTGYDAETAGDGPVHDCVGDLDPSKRRSIDRILSMMQEGVLRTATSLVDEDAS